MSALRPCPFCGKIPTSFPAQDGPGLLIECVTTTCVRPQFAAYGEGVAEAVWNNRLCEPRSERGVEARPVDLISPLGDGIAAADITWPPDAVTLAAYGKYRNAREEKLSGRSAMRSALREAMRVQSLKPFTASADPPRDFALKVRYPSSK